MAVADRHGLSVAVYVESATPHEVKLATSTLVQMILPEAPQNLIGDNAYDSEAVAEFVAAGYECARIRRISEVNRSAYVRSKRASRKPGAKTWPDFASVTQCC
jgi:hypothetical protein